MKKKLEILRVSSMKGYRPFHWFPKIYSGVNGVTTKLFVLWWFSVEFK
jgi:hypothetical protein